MRPWLCAPAAVLVGLSGIALSACETPSRGRAQATADTTLTVALGGRTLVLDGVAGDVTLVRDSTLADAADLVLTRWARGATRASAARRLPGVRIATASDADLAQVVWRGADGAPGFGADARVHVPPGTSVVVRLGAGSVSTRALDGGLDAETGGGTVRLDAHTGDRLRVRVTQGLADVRAARVPPEGRWFVSVGAGDVALALPSASSATVLASTAEGRVTTGALPVTVVERRVLGPRSRLRARLGEGAAVVRVETAVGDVTLREAGASDAP